MFDITFFGAFIAGLLSFLSPCVLPIVPFYLSYLVGVGINQLNAQTQITAVVRMRAFLAACMFSLGVITVFVGFGATATMFGQMLRDYFDFLRWLAAAVIFAMGLHFLGIMRLGILYRQFRSDAGSTSNINFIGAFVIGLAFAFGWTPCVGPVLAALFLIAAGQDSAMEGSLLLFVYGTGMTFPFILAATFIGTFLHFLSKFRKHLWKVEKIMGVLLILFALLIATSSIRYIAEWMLNTFPIFVMIG
ncbi:MAG: sulfite exporter TauE/SafE family protein [Aestuariivita sp.]|nr:sulfite exporter TauE/SafE family protein [Aestuariivita sp.]